MTGSADFLRVGDWNVRCDRCGKKLKGSDARQTWQGWWVCPEHWEPRQAQDFVRSVVEHPTPAFVRNPADLWVATPGQQIILETDSSSLNPLWDDDQIIPETGAGYLISDS